MFTGIVKDLGEIESISPEGSNVHVRIRSRLLDGLSIDQSVAHDGVCLTVSALDEKAYTVTAVKETLARTTLGAWEPGRHVNIELAMRSGARLDGHFVQGHVDTTAECVRIEDEGGSWAFRFRFAPGPERVLVDKGSVCVNGISLTVVDPTIDEFGVAIIPYTYEHTTFKDLEVGNKVNIEFDIIGKYILRQAVLYGNTLGK